MYLLALVHGHRGAADRGGRARTPCSRCCPRPCSRVTRELVDVLYFPVLAITLVLALTTLYKIALPYKPPWWRGLPGAVLAAVVFLLGATGLRLYLTG